MGNTSSSSAKNVNPPNETDTEQTNIKTHDSASNGADSDQSNTRDMTLSNPATNRGMFNYWQALMLSEKLSVPLPRHVQVIVGHYTRPSPLPCLIDLLNIALGLESINKDKLTEIKNRLEQNPSQYGKKEDKQKIHTEIRSIFIEQNNLDDNVDKKLLIKLSEQPKEHLLIAFYNLMFDPVKIKCGVYMEYGDNMHPKEIFLFRDLLCVAATYGLENLANFMSESDAGKRTLHRNDTMFVRLIHHRFKIPHSAFVCAVKNRHIEVVKFFIEKSGKDVIKSYLGKKCDNSLMHAINNADYDMVKLLIDSGANCDAVDKNNNSVMDYANASVSKNRDRIIELVESNLNKTGLKK